MIPPGRVLGVDLGSRRIGVAVTDSAQRVALGVAVLTRTRDQAADDQALAAGTLRAEGRRPRDQRNVIDQNAAALLLQTWVEQRLSAEGTGAVER